MGEALREAARRLEATSDTARLDAELLMAHALGVSRSDMLLRCSADPVPPAFAGLVERRAAHEPVAHIVGSQEFYGRTFRVTADTLIPRADSESVVEAALAAAPGAQRVLDCGTGTGALLLTLLAELPQAQGVGTDRSPEALAVARENAAQLGLEGRSSLHQADWDNPGWADDLGRFDLVISNPPYVEDDAPLERDVREYEPAGALFAGAEGLDAYRVLVPQLPGLLVHNGVAVLEIGHTQADAVAEIAAQSGFTALRHHDLAGRPRALELRLGLGKG